MACQTFVILQVPLARMSHEKARSDPMGFKQLPGSPTPHDKRGDHPDAAIDFIYHDMQHARLWFFQNIPQSHHAGKCCVVTVIFIFLEQALPICPQCQELMFLLDDLLSIDFLRTPGLRRSDAVRGMSRSVLK